MELSSPYRGSFKDRILCIPGWQASLYKWVVSRWVPPPNRLLVRPSFLMAVVWEPCERLPNYKLHNCKGL